MVAILAVMSDGIQVFDGDGFESTEQEHLLKLRDLDHARQIIFSLAGQIASLGMVSRAMREVLIKQMTAQLFEENPELQRRVLHHTNNILKRNELLSKCLKKEFR